MRLALVLAIAFALTVVGCTPPGPRPRSEAELIALFPRSAGGIALSASAMNAEELEALGPSPGEGIAERLGVDPSRVTLAGAVGERAATSDYVFVFANHVPEVETERLANAVLAESRFDGPPVLVEMGGKQVLRGLAPGGRRYIYATGEVVFMVMASDDAIAEDAIRQLP